MTLWKNELMTLSPKQIRAVRIANGIKQHEFAEFIGVPVGTWSNVELGNAPLYSDVQIKAVRTLNELECDFSILDKEDNDFPKGAHAVGGKRDVVKGVSKEEPRVTNDQGGSQSRVLYDFSLADPKAMFEMTKVLKEGADKYGAENWRLIDVKDHLNHMLIHAYAYLAGDTSDDHLSHIMCRALFAQGVAVQTEEDIQRVKQQKEG